MIMAISVGFQSYLMKNLIIFSSSQAFHTFPSPWLMLVICHVFFLTIYTLLHIRTHLHSNMNVWGGMYMWFVDVVAVYDMFLLKWYHIMHINLEKEKSSFDNYQLVCPTTVTLAMFPIEHKWFHRISESDEVCLWLDKWDRNTITL